MRKFVAMLAFGGLVAGLGAVPAAAGSGNVKKFCNTYLAINKALNAEQPSETKVSRLLDTAVDAAPADIADAVETAANAIQENFEGFFEDPEFGPVIGEIDAFAAEECADEQIDVSLQDYAFDGIPDEIDAGVVAFNITNEGTELHELVVFRLKSGATLDDVLGGTEETFEEFVQPVPLGGGFAAPGESGYAVVPLKKAGNYVALCFVPVGSTDEAAAEAAGMAGAPPHLTEGMAAEFEVVK